ncbi:MAG: SUF system Fe-S cluster assembly protein [candidate division KSB1 bacterium]
METNNDTPNPLREDIIKALQTCYDPEIPVNIYELGLVYNVEVNEAQQAHIRMTLTSPACPVAGILPVEVETKAKAVPGVTDAKVELVWEPQWNPSMMSEAAKLELGFF